jgi:hypothetical protein
VTVTGEFVALLATVTVPEKSIADDGVNLTASVAVPPAAIESPDVTPDGAYAAAPVPVTVTLETVTLAFPTFVRVTLSELLLPTFTFPKAKLFALELRINVAATPVPVSGIAKGDVALLFVSETEPLTAPAEAGAKVTLNVVFPPAAIFSGSVSPLMLYPAPDALA